MTRVARHRSQVTGLLAAMLLYVAAASAQDDPVAALQNRVQEASAKATEAFVFLGGGSGVLVSADGWVITNFHVVAGMGGKAPDSTKVNLADGRHFTARIVCTDPLGDLALLKIEPPEGKPFGCLELGDSDKLECGQYVIAVGNPFNLGSMPTTDRKFYPAVSLGIISALHRYQQQYSDCIQTDAAVNPGNSGGPLVTLEGKMVGLNGRIATRYNNRVNSGVGYAIPSNQILNFLPEMKKGGIDKKVYHGQIRGLDIDEDGDTGVKVQRVGLGTPAARAGFKEGDRIVQVNGYAISSPYRFFGVIGIYPMDTEVEVRVKRGDEEKALKVRLVRTGALDILGREVKPGGAYLGVILEDKEGGAEVTYVAAGSPADKAGLEVGDVIVKVDDRAVEARETVLERVRLRKPGDRIKLAVKRGDQERELTVTLGSRDE